MLAEVSFNPATVHFTGHLDPARFRAIQHVSMAHIYLTYPFVLSWSLIEAMATGCLVIGSRTAPVEEVIQDGRNGLLTDFFDHMALADRVDEALSHPQKFFPLRDAAPPRRRVALRPQRGLPAPAARPHRQLRGEALRPLALLPFTGEGAPRSGDR